MKSVKLTKMMTTMLLSVFLLVGIATASGATMSVVSPNGGESLVAGTSTEITWTSDVTGNVRITLLKSDLQMLVIAAGTPNDGTHTWSIPETFLSGSDYKVKIASCLDPTVFDLSDDFFSINGTSGGTIAVVSPNGGEVFTAGTVNNITWTSDITGNLRITLLKAGLHYALIASSTPNDGVFEWSVSPRLAAGDDYSVKIASVTYPSLFDLSDATFSVSPGGGTYVTVLSPNGGESFVAGAVLPITWTSDVTGYLRLSLQKAGADVMLISAKTLNDGAFDWTIPTTLPSADDYTVKILYCMNTEISDVSDAPFEITGGIGSTVTVVSPNGGETFTAGTTNTITWTSDLTGNVKITLLKAGLHYALISLSTPNDGSFDWLIPSRLAAGSEYAVKVSSVDSPFVFDVSDAYFNVVAGGGTNVTVVAPNGGETFAAGSVCPITWTSDVTSFLRLSLQKAGVDYMLISAKTTNDGAFDWTIPETMAAGSDYTVKISSCLNPNLSDVSDATFEITGGSGSSVTVLAPNGGEIFTSGTLNTITWNSDVTGNVRITLLKAGAHYALISAGTPNDGSFDWNVPLGLAAGNEYAVKIASVTNALVFDTSDNYFEVVQGTSGTTVAVTAPNGGEIFVLGTSNDITWTSDITGNVRITLLKGGVQVATIAFGTPNDGLYTWTVSPMLAPGTDYTVKVGSCINPLVFDESDAPFEIAESDGVVSKTALKTAVLETNEQLTLSLYPNPASEVLNIVSGSTINHVWVMNSLGQTVFETPLNSTQLQLDVNEMLPDMYFVRIESEGTFTTHKIFVK